MPISSLADTRYIEGTYALQTAASPKTTAGGDGTHCPPRARGDGGAYGASLELAVHLYRTGPFSSRHSKAAARGEGGHGHNDHADQDDHDGGGGSSGCRRWRPPSLVQRRKVGLPDGGDGVGEEVMLFERRPVEPDNEVDTVAAPWVAGG